MHIALIILTLIITWIWADWKHWYKYERTMLYVAMANLLYNFIYYDHWLWQLKSDFIITHTILEMFYTFIVFPCSVLLFFTNYPNSIKKQTLHVLKYIAVYFAIEVVFYRFGKFIYNYGWNLWWSLAWDCVMFPLWILHYKKPILAYLASFVLVVIVLRLFPVSFKTFGFQGIFLK